MLPSMNVMKNPSATPYVKSSQCYSVSVTAGISDQLCRLSVSQEDTAAASARKSQKPLFPDSQRDKAASPPPTNVKALPRRRNRGTSNQVEVLSHSPNPPMESLSIPAKGSSGWTRPIWSCQTTERGLEVEPDPQWNTGKTRGSTRKQTVLPPQASPDRDDASPEQSSDGSLKIRRAKRSNRLHKKRGGDSPQLQHLETNRMEVKRRDRGRKDKNIKISEPANVKSSTSSRKPKMHKASAHILAEEEEEKWAEDELAALQEYVWFPVKTAQCCLIELESNVCLFIQGSGALPKTQGRLLGKGGEACGNAFCRRVLQAAHFSGNLPLAAHERQEKGKETAGSTNRPR